MVFDALRFREAFAAHTASFFRFCFRLTRDATDAEDLVQDSALAVWRKREQCRDADALPAILRRTAFRLFCNGHAKRKRRLALAPPPGPAAFAEPAADVASRADSRRVALAHVHAGLDALPDDQREAFLLFRFEGLTCAAIADATGVPVKTIETRVRRATLALAERLQRHGALAEA